MFESKIEGKVKISLQLNVCAKNTFFFLLHANDTWFFSVSLWCGFFDNCVCNHFFRLKSLNVYKENLSRIL
jgi:hypothetical protein